jgi:hypothetical protein
MPDGYSSSPGQVSFSPPNGQPGGMTTSTAPPDPSSNGSSGSSPCGLGNYIIGGLGNVACGSSTAVNQTTTATTTTTTRDGFAPVSIQTTNGGKSKDSGRNASFVWLMMWLLHFVR